MKCSLAARAPHEDGRRSRREEPTLTLRCAPQMQPSRGPPECEPSENGWTQGTAPGTCFCTLSGTGHLWPLALSPCLEGHRRP